MNPDDIHRITRGEIENILGCLRSIDRLREALSRVEGNRAEAIADLKRCTDGIYSVVKDLPRFA